MAVVWLMGLLALAALIAYLFTLYAPLVEDDTIRLITHAHLEKGDIVTISYKKYFVKEFLSDHGGQYVYEITEV